MSAAEKNSGTTETQEKKGRPVLILIAILTLCTLVSAYLYLHYQKNHYVKTNNASVQGNSLTISAETSGDILEIKVKQGDYVQGGDVLVILKPKLANTEMVDYSYLRAPRDGTVLKTVGATGQSIAPGLTLVYLESDEDKYIVSNIDEKDINKIRLGQDVDVTIDQYGKERFAGKVAEVGVATLSSFSVVQSTSSGSFIKTSKNVPVKIRFARSYENLLLGGNATVRIHIR